MPPKNAQRSRNRPTTPQSPPKHSAPRASPRQTRRGTRSSSREINETPAQQKQAIVPLPIVDEDPVSDDEIEVAQLSAPSESEAISDDQDASEDIDDATSDDATQLEALDTDLIVDNLPTLYHTADRILSFLNLDDTPNLLADINDPLSRTSIRLRNFVSNFDVSREVYGGRSYISIALILRKLLPQSELIDGPWRPDAVLQLANLCLLVVELFQTDDAAVHDTLERMFNTFPEPFGHFELDVDQSRYSTKLVSETLSFGIALRTQFFLKVAERLQHDPSFDPDAVLQKVFFDEDGSINGFQAEGDNPLPEAESQILKRVEKIRRFFSRKSASPIKLAPLKQRYSWQGFVTEALRWASLRKEELNAQIAAQGGIEHVHRRLKQSDFAPYTAGNLNRQNVPAIEKPTDDQAPAQVEESKQPSTRGADSRSVAKRIAVLKAAIQADEESSEEDDEEDQQSEGRQENLVAVSDQLKSARAEIPQSPGAALEVQENWETIDDNVIGGDDEESGPPIQEMQKSTPPKATQGGLVPTQQTLAILELERQQAALGNKENIDITRRYADKQANAKRLQWDDSQTGQKRPRQLSDDEDEDDEEDDFESDSRPQKRARLPRQPAPRAIDEWIDANADDGDEDLDVQASEQLRQDDLRSSPRARPPGSSQPLGRDARAEGLTLNEPSRPPASSAPQSQNRPHEGVEQSPRRLASSSRQRRSPTPTPPPPPSSTTAPDATAQSHRAVNAQAKETLRLRPLLDPNFPSKQPQMRRAWSEAETNRLFELIALHGCAWAHILAEDVKHSDGPELQTRTQVQLKDKARNLKMDYLKAGAELPEGFEAVTIKSADKQLLRELGLPY